MMLWSSPSQKYNKRVIVMRANNSKANLQINAGATNNEYTVISSVYLRQHLYAIQAHCSI
jgi:hypothetical protein